MVVGEERESWRRENERKSVNVKEERVLRGVFALAAMVVVWCGVVVFA